MAQLTASATPKATDSKDYDDGVAEGLEIVIQNVKTLAGQTSDPQRLLLGLRGLIEMTEKKQQVLQHMTGNPPAYDVNFKFDKTKNPRVFSDYGKGEGFRKAVVALRWFLNDA